jgi:hypothetical protein
MSSWVSKVMAGLLALFFLGGMYGCVGMFSSVHSTMDRGTHCPMMGVNGVCQTPIDHLSYWNNFLNVTPLGLPLLVLVLALVSAYLWMCRNHIGKFVIHLLAPHKPPLRSFHHLARHALQDAFSNGILNPKLYSFLM